MSAGFRVSFAASGVDFEHSSLRGVAWEGMDDLSRFIQDAPRGTKANVVLCGGDVFATRPIAADDELFADYGSDYWGKRMRQTVTCVSCLEEECFETKLVQCTCCKRYTHVGCVQAFVESGVRSFRHVRAPHHRLLDTLPRCGRCRTPWPPELAGRNQCGTPGCTLPDFHEGKHSTDSELKRRRSQTHGIADG
jgi:hypothetical protein